MLVVGFHHKADAFGAEQFAAQASEHARFEHGTVHGPARAARAGATRVRAAPLLAADDDEGSAALTAAHQAGQQALRPALHVVGPIFLRRFAPADRFPAFVIDNPKVWHVLALPLVGRVHSRDTLAGVGIADHRRAIVDEAADVDLVAENAIAADRITVDGTDVPVSSRRGRHAFGIQPACDRDRRFAGNELGVDPAHNVGLVGIDLPQATFCIAPRVQAMDLAVAIDDVARSAPGRDAAALPALDLVGQILAEQAGHRSLETDLQFVDRPFRQREYPRAQKADALVDAGKIFLVARKAVDRLGHHLVGVAGAHMLDQGVEAGPIAHGAGDSEVGEDGCDRPGLALSALRADANLILDRGVLLQLAAETGVDRRAH